jgi:hypothetical protein
LYWLEPPPGTNVTSQGRVGASSNPPGTSASHLYWVVARSSTNVRITHLYRVRICLGTNVGDICTRQPNYPVQASLSAPLVIFSKSCLLFYSIFHSSSSFSLILISFFILVASHISLDLPCRAPSEDRSIRGPVDGRSWM